MQEKKETQKYLRKIPLKNWFKTKNNNNIIIHYLIYKTKVL